MIAPWTPPFWMVFSRENAMPLLFSQYSTILHGSQPEYLPNCPHYSLDRVVGRVYNSGRGASYAVGGWWVGTCFVSHLNKTRVRKFSPLKTPIWHPCTCPRCVHTLQSLNVRLLFFHNAHTQISALAHPLGVRSVYAFFQGPSKPCMHSHSF